MQFRSSLFVALLPALVACSDASRGAARGASAAADGPVTATISLSHPEIVAATKLAYALEDTVEARWDSIRSEAELSAIFARGFEPDVAARLTARLWDSTSNNLTGAEQAIAAPDSVVVLYVSADSAEVAFVTPVLARWAPERPYTVAWLRRRGGVWRVGGARDVDTPPAPLPNPAIVPAEGRDRSV